MRVALCEDAGMTYRGEGVESPILVVAFGGRVFGLDVVSGARVWGYEGMRHSQSTVVRLALDRGRVYAVAHPTLACLDHATGEELWYAHLEKGGGTLVASGGRVFVGGNGTVTCFDQDGRQLWHDGFKGKGLGTVALALPDTTVQADA